MSSIFITIKESSEESWVELVTEAHQDICPIASSSSDELAYDWCVCPKDPNESAHSILSGSCEWQCCGYEEYAIDLPNNLIAGMIAYEISNDYESFLSNPEEWLDILSVEKSLEVILILEVFQI